MSRVYAALLVSLGILAGSLAPASADQLVIKDGFGEELSVRDGWFGRKDTVIKDRLGNKVVRKKGWFGSRQTEVNLLGNQFKKKKGWFGRSDIEASTILGDKITTRKGLFGNRTTTVDVSGVASAIRTLFAKEEAQPSASNQASGLDTSLPPELKNSPDEQRVPRPTYSGP
ncbi:MAG TPA: hypothetical protein V6D08_12360 [Candidatus Obscuribacterales bacterium]